MKKLFALLLAAALLLALCACGSKPAAEPAPQPAAGDGTAQEEPVTEEDPTVPQIMTSEDSGDGADLD